MRPAGIGFLFAILLVLCFITGPTLEFWFGDPQSNASVVVSAAWFGAFLLAGAAAGHAVAGRRGQFGFSIAFGIVAFFAVLVISTGLAFEDRWPESEKTLTLVLLSLAYPLTFATMGSVAVAIASRNRRAVLAAARSFGLGGCLGGMILSAALAFRLGGTWLAVVFAASLAIPAFIGGRRTTLLLERCPYVTHEA